MSHVLVTGGCGFIGSHFVRRLLALEPETRVTNLDALTYAGNPDNLADVAGNPRYRFAQGDIADPADVQAAIRPFEGAPVDTIVNFAAESHVDRSIEDAGPFLRTNILGVHVLLEAARRLRDGAGAFRSFLQVSTDEVYGSLPETGRFSETSPLDPSSPYSAAKTSGDLLACAFHRTHGLPVVVTRCSNNYGPHQFPEKLIPVLINNACRDRRLPIYGTGKNVRDWIYVLDHVDGILAALRRGRPGEVYNFGADTERTNLEITREVLRLVHKPETLIEFVTDRLGHDLRYAIDSSKAREELGWEPRVHFASGLESTVSWYLENQDWSERAIARARSMSNGH